MEGENGCNETCIVKGVKSVFALRDSSAAYKQDPYLFLTLTAYHQL